MRIPHLLAAAALLGAAAPPPAAAQSGTTPEAAPGAWSYAGPTAPEFWSRLQPANECAGQRQSPVDLPRMTAVGPLGVSVAYPAANPASLVNNGHTVDLFLQNRNLATLHVADSTFEFREVHFHVPAEHTVQRERFDAEIHTVHQLGNGNRAVLTTFVRAGAHNQAWNAVIASLPGNKGDSIAIGPVNLTALLAVQHLAGESVYSYAGSLTTPLCTPNVRFIIRVRPIVLSRAQIDALASAFARNVRPVQHATTPIILHRGGP